MQVISAKELEEMILKKLESLGHQHDAIFRDLANMRDERNKAVADLKAAHQRCSFWIRMWTISVGLLFVVSSYVAYLLYMNL